MKWLLSIFLMITSSAFAGNEHEHLQYLMSYDDIVQATQGKLGSYPATSVLGDLRGNGYSFLYPLKVIENLTATHTQIYFNGEISHKRIRTFFLNLIQTSTLETFSKKVALAFQDPSITSEQVMRGLFEISPLQPNPTLNYEIAGIVRSALFKHYPDVFLKSIEIHVNQAPASELTKSVFSIPSSMLDETLLTKVKGFYLKRNVQVQFYVSIPRRNLVSLDENIFSEKITKIESAIDEGWLDGVDVSGSIEEATDLNFAQNKENLLISNFEKIFQISRSRKIPLRVHAFEGSNRGAFYDAFWKILEDCKNKNCLPSSIRIGHIQALSSEDLLRLKKYFRASDIIFEANIESNLILQDQTEEQKLANRIQQIHDQHLRVVIGSDGLGILGNTASFENTLLHLKASGLSSSSLEKLIRDAYIPVTGTRISKVQLLQWQKDRDEMRHVILGEGIPPVSKFDCNPPMHAK